MRLVLSDCKWVYNPTSELLEEVEKSLIFPNPAYIKACRFSKYNVTKIPKELVYFLHSGNVLAVPLGYDLSKYSFESIRDIRVYKEVEVPEFNLELREDQKKAVESYLEKPEDNIIQMRTGKGKSIVALNLAYRLKGKTLIIVHKDDLVTGWKNDISLCFPEEKVGLIKAKKKEIGNFITIATVQTLNKLPLNELDNLRKEFSIIVHDELHNVGANSFDISSSFVAKYKIGLTATPERNDGLSFIMNLHFGGICFVMKVDRNDKDILPFTIYRKKVNLFIEPLYEKYYKKKQAFIRLKGYCLNSLYETKENEFFPSQLDYKELPKVKLNEIEDLYMLSQELGDLVLSDIEKEVVYYGRSCVVFCSKKEHCLIYYNNLVDLLGEDRVQLLYGDSKEKTETLIKKAEEREVLVTVTTYSKSNEGTNVKEWQVAFLLSSIANEKTTEQVVGRVIRTKEDKENMAYVYDYRFPYVYIFKKHGEIRDKRYRKLKGIFDNSFN